VTPEAQRTVARQAADRGQIVRFLAETVRVEARHGRVGHPRPVEALEPALIERVVRARGARRLELEERLVGGHLAGLCRPRATLELLQRLPAEPAELVVVP